MSILPTIADVSEHQGVIDWNAVKSNTHFDIIRVQDGTYLDRRLANNVAACEQLGIPYYLYGFYRNGGATEANRMIARARAVGANHCKGYIVDLEVAGFSRDGIRSAIQTLKNAGGKAGLYIAHHLYGTYGADYGQDWTWIPKYGTNNGQPQSMPSYPCDLWQFTSTGRIPGIGGNVDCNACVNKDLGYFTDGSIIVNPNPPVNPPTYNEIVPVHYALRKLNGEWWPTVTNFNNQNGDGYAGNGFQKHDLLTAWADEGTLKYRVHYIGGSWLEWISKSDKNDTVHGCAGIPGKVIDGVQFYYITPSGKQYKQAWYRSQSTADSGWYAVCCDDGTTYTNYDSYAGIYGKPLDKLQLSVSSRNPF